MRRKDREKNGIFALEIIRDCEYATFATVNPDGTPYCIPVSPVLLDGAVYFHCATEGQKLDNIKNNNNVCLSCVRYTNLLPKKFTTEYESAVAFGKCEIVLDKTKKIAALRAIGEKYAKINMGNFDSHIEKYWDNTCISKIVIEKITGKANIQN